MDLVPVGAKLKYHSKIFVKIDDESVSDIDEHIQDWPDGLVEIVQMPIELGTVVAVISNHYTRKEGYEFIGKTGTIYELLHFGRFRVEGVDMILDSMDVKIINKRWL